MIKSGSSRRLGNRQLSLSETMTILVSFHISNCRNFPAFYLGIVKNYWRSDFANLVSYSRFIEWIPSTIVPLMIYLRLRSQRRSPYRGRSSSDDWGRASAVTPKASRLGTAMGIGLNAGAFRHSQREWRSLFEA